MIFKKCADESKKSVKFLEEEICGLRKKKMEMLESMDDKRYSLKSLFIYLLYLDSI
jgi:hypothetical protein